MANETHCCTFTRGEFYMRDAVQQCASGVSGIACQTGTPFKKIGNVSSGLIEILGTVLGKENKFNPADPSARVEVLGVSLTLSISCSSVKNLRSALIAESPEVGPSSRTQDIALCSTLEDGDFFPFEKKGVVAPSVEVYLLHNSVIVATLIQGVDYMVSSSGIQLIRDGVNSITSDILRFVYFYDDSNFSEIQFFSEIPKYKEVYFKGINYGDEGKSLFDANLYRVLFAPINQMDLITREEFLTINLTGSVEKFDEQWFKITKQE